MRARSGAHGLGLKFALLAAVTAGLVSVQSLIPRASSAAGAAASPGIAQVRYILHGLSVQPPHRKRVKGKVKDPLYNQYEVSTGARQKASINFKDSTLLDLNQLTDAVLRSPAVTQVRKGEVREQVVPGTNHSVQTAAAVASAIGTIFDVRVAGKVTIITVIEGSVLVKNKAGSVVVKSGEQTRVQKGKAPTPPQPVDAAATTRWTSPIPPPAAPLGLNIALDANGGSIYQWTSQRADPSHAFDAHNANDGRLDTGWASADGQATNQSLWLRFQGLHAYTIAAIFLDCAATAGLPATAAARDFEVLASDATNESGFSPALEGTCSDANQVQVFPLSAPVKATYIQLLFKNNHAATSAGRAHAIRAGRTAATGTGNITVAEVGVISVEKPATLGTPTPETPTATPVPPTATDTPTAPPSATNTVTPLPATATATPTPAPPTLTPIHAVFNQATFSTLYTENASGQGLTYQWEVSIPADPPCANGFQPNKPQPNQATWFHEDVSQGGPCNHSGTTYNAAGRGHPGTVTVTVSDTYWRCQATYFGTEGDNGNPAGDGPAPQPCQPKP